MNVFKTEIEYLRREEHKPTVLLLTSLSPPCYLSLITPHTFRLSLIVRFHRQIINASYSTPLCSAIICRNKLSVFNIMNNFNNFMETKSVEDIIST